MIKDLSLTDASLSMEVAKKVRKAIPEKTRKKLLVYCGHECCIPTCNKRRRNEIHHINGDPGDNRWENLIPLCPTDHEDADRGIFKDKELLMYKEAKIKKVGVRESLEKKEIPSEKFTDVFSLKLDEIVEALEKGERYPLLSDKIDELIMLLKERIEKWDVPSVRFGTKELFYRLYKHSGEGKEITGFYIIFKDLFNLAYKERQRILGNMISVFYYIWLETWLSDYDIERAEKCCDILLRLGLDYLDKDIKIAEACLNEITNASGDMFEPEILSREILFGAAIEKRKDESQEFKRLFESVLNYIEYDELYSHDANLYDYLINSLEYAKRIQDEYDLDIMSFKEKYLLKMIEEFKNEKVESYADYLEETVYMGEDEGEGIDDIQFCGELLEMEILAYRDLYPEIHQEYSKAINAKNDKKVTVLFNNIIDNRNYLKHIFKGEDMITSMEEFIKFMEQNSHFEESKVGVGFWGDATIHFKHPLSDEEKRKLERLSHKYEISDSFEVEIDKHYMTFLIDALVYKKGRDGVEKFIQLLKELNESVQITKVTTSMEFKFT